MKNSPCLSRLCVLAAAALVVSAHPVLHAEAPASQVLFDDFSYSSPDEMELHGWMVRTKPGWPGIDGATWRKDGVSFHADPDNPGNTLLRMTSSTDGTPANTFQTQICQQRKFKDGTYAARVHFSDGAASGPSGDGVVESCYTLAPLVAPWDPNYSECDFEYLPIGGWGEKGPTLFVTTWKTYSPEPNWKKDNIFSTVSGREGGWHVLVAQVVGGHVKYFLDGKQIADHAGRFYPRDIMSFNFNLWFMREAVLPSKERRVYEEQIDWVYFQKDEAVSSEEVVRRVDALRKAGIKRQDTVEATGLPCPCNS